MKTLILLLTVSCLQWRPSQHVALTKEDHTKVPVPKSAFDPKRYRSKEDAVASEVENTRIDDTEEINFDPNETIELDPITDDASKVENTKIDDTEEINFDPDAKNDLDPIIDVAVASEVENPRLVETEEINFDPKDDLTIDLDSIKDDAVASEVENARIDDTEEINFDPKDDLTIDLDPIKETSSGRVALDDDVHPVLSDLSRFSPNFFNSSTRQGGGTRQCNTCSNGGTTIRPTPRWIFVSPVYLLVLSCCIQFFISVW